MAISGIPILNYHAIDPGVDASTRNVSVSLEAFGKQMEWLHNQGYKTIGRQQLSDVILAGKKLSDKYVLITFDDGYLSLHQYALPLLSGLGFTATLFLSTSFIGKPYEQQDFGFVNHDRQLTWREIKDLVAGGWSIQSHGNRHERLNKLSLEEVEQEATISKNIIEQNLGTKVDSFAFPYGIYTNKVIKKLKAAGYQFAYSVHSGKLFPRASRYQLPRIEINNTDTIDTFVTKVTTGYTSPSNARRSKIRDIIYGNAAVKDIIEKFTPMFGFGNH
jgi:peptidoglycan/xylan/chitin deacetylase (PgdA/CDA1 family)